jgi:photosystem II stability/assembly factor-like uncharacterized protein
VIIQKHLYIYNNGLPREFIIPQSVFVRMLIAGTEDGLYRVSNVANGGESTVEQVLDAGAVMRVRRFDDDNGVFAATESGLYYSVDGTEWEDLAVPEESVYSVAIDPEGTIYAGTRPARVFVSEMDSSNPTAVNEWRELDGFQELPSRDEWRLPRHENLAQVRDLHVTPEAPDRVVAGVEVGGVHVSDDGGQTWYERRNGVDDDIHELRVLDQNEFVAATGFGLFYSEDEGRSWTRLDEGVDQRYFRTVFGTDGAIYAGSALAHTATWDDDDADPALFVSRDASSLDRLEYPRPDETITGITTAEGDLTVATHRGTILVLRRGDWLISGSLPASNQFAGSYTPLEWVAS